MASNEIRASAVVQAPAAHVYSIIADYRDGHPRIVPPKYFKWMCVDSGGTGAGTTISFGMRVLGVSKTLKAMISEPDPGRVLLEAYPADGTRTTFTVDPEGAAASHVTIATVFSPRPGLAAAFERFVSRMVLPSIYRQELQRLAEHAEGRLVHEPVMKLEGRS